MAEAIAGLGADGETWREAGETARSQVRRTYALDRVAAAWTDLLVTGRVTDG
jgi:glycosyltransferase involved in cell wall biosynthesis